MAERAPILQAIPGAVKTSMVMAVNMAKPDIVEKVMADIALTGGNPHHPGNRLLNKDKRPSESHPDHHDHRRGKSGIIQQGPGGGYDHQVQGDIQ